MTEAEAWDIARLDAHAQAALVHGGEIAPDGLVEAAIVRIEELDPALSSVSHRAFDTARIAARSVDRTMPMAGVPYLLKDSIDYPGMPLRSGSRARRDDMGRKRWPLAQAFDAVGLIPVGKSTMPEFGLNATGETLLNGDTRNPWNLAHSAGGSSTGAAAAVAAGLVPFAHASDAGGSIRLPASNCGIIGFKPSRGWNLRARAYNLVDDILCSDGLYGRSVRDTAWAARALRPADKAAGPLPSRPLRIALDLTGFDGRTADPDVDAVILQAAKLCADLGHVVEAVRQPIDGPALRRSFTDLWAYLGGEIVDLYSNVPDTPVEDLLEPWTLGLAVKRAEVSPERLAEALAMIDRTTQALADFHRSWDVVLSPVTRSVPPRLGHLSPSQDFDALWVALFDYVNYTPLHNMTGATSLSLPLFMSADGLPVGALFSALPGDDDILLALAAELEAAQPWIDRWPPAATARPGDAG